MESNIRNFKKFYSSLLGKIITQIISKKISSLWPVFNNSRNAVIGFGTPFINIFNSNIQRLFFLIPRKFGLYNFPSSEKNLTVSINDTTLPIEDLSTDRLLVINFFEYLFDHKKFLREAWRILDKDGEIIIITPNTFGLWRFFYKKKFKSLRTFSSHELSSLLQNNFFTPTNIEYSIFLPPIKNKYLTRKIKFFEFFNNRLTKYFSGIIIIKGKKNYLAPITNNREVVKHKIKSDIKA